MPSVTAKCVQYVLLKIIVNTALIYIFFHHNLYFLFYDWKIFGPQLNVRIKKKNRKKIFPFPLILSFEVHLFLPIRYQNVI